MTQQHLKKTTIKQFTTYMKKYPELYEKLALIVKHHTQAKNPLIVDLGVGPGLLSQTICQKIQDARIIGIDPNPDMLTQALTTITCPTVQLLSGTLEHLPINKNQIDTVVTRYTLAYWTDPVIGFQEIFRILKPGGICIIEALNRTYPSWKRLLTRLHMHTKKAGTAVIKYHFDTYQTAYTQNEVEQYLTTTGFTILDKHGAPKEWRFCFIALKPRKKL